MRRFRVHQRRWVEPLDGVWDFAFLGDVRASELEPRALVFDDAMPVPGCFDATPRYAMRRGLAAYRRALQVPERGRHRLVFHGVQHVAHVFFDGVPCGQHAGGFTRFELELGQLEAGEHELLVLVDNRLDPAGCPLHLDYFDWYQYGGIARSVELERLPGTWIRALQVDTLGISPPRVELRIDYESSAPSAPLRVSLAGRLLLAEEASLGSSGRITRQLELPGAALWSPESPALHLLRVELGADDLAARVGLRTLAVKERKLWLNGEPLVLCGVNRHQSYPLAGHAVPDSVNLADAQLIRELGANFVRGAHYPQDPGFLDLCDELGLCVWNESIGWQHTKEQLCEPRFIDAQLGHLREMVAMSRNHPSVILWGVLNEGHSQEAAARPGYQRLLGELRALDATRPVTFASMFGYGDRCFDLADVVSVNTYPGWYQHELADVDAELERLLAQLARSEPDKPVIISEIGAAALYGCHELGGGRWTEEYQARLLDAVIAKLFGSGERVAGLAIWQYTDTRTSDRVSVVLGKPRGYNNKGLLDEYRRPKLAYGAVKRALHSLHLRRKP